MRDRFDIEQVLRITGLDTRADQADGGADFDVACRIAVKKIMKAKEYEDLEEQGKLLKLPCAVGDTIYVIPSKTNYILNAINCHKELNRVREQIVNRIEISRSGYLLSTCDGMSSAIGEFYEVTWFLTKEEANTALEELARECKEMGYEIN